MRPDLVVIGSVILQNATQLRFVEHDQVVEAFAPNRADEALDVAVPALVSEDSFARAQELLQENKIRSRRRTITPSIVQGLVSCQKCGYAFSRTSTYTTARKIHYYKCIGSDGWRKLGGPVCDNVRLVRQDLLDQIVWTEVIRLLEDPRQATFGWLARALIRLPEPASG